MLVTGGAGFLGSTLVDRLLAEGHSVDVVDNLSGGSLANLAEARGAPGHELTFHQLDVRSADLVALMERRRPEVVFHLAAPDPDADPVDDAETTVVGSLRVLEAAYRSGAGKVVFSSDPAIYGALSASDLPVRETHAQRPLRAYGVAKKAVTDYLVSYRERHDLEFTSLALSSVYGPRQERGVIAALGGDLLAGRAGTVTGDGRQTRDFVYVDDAVDALARAAQRGSGLLLNIATGTETSVGELYRLLATLSGVEIPPLRAPARPEETRRMALDPRRASLHLGWKPWTPLAEGVGATLSWLRQRP